MKRTLLYCIYNYKNYCCGGGYLLHGMSSKCTCSIGLQHALNLGKEVAIHVKVDDRSSDACRKTCYQ